MNTLDVFQNFRRILCLCPCCGEIHRLSDLHLKYRGKVAKTWLDEYEHKSELLQKREDKFMEKEQGLREKARAAGRKKAQAAFNKAISPKFKRLGLNPYDVKPLLHPIDFLVFNGMNENNTIDDITFLSSKSTNKGLNTIRKSVKDVIAKKEYEWRVARVDETGKIGFE